MIVTQEIKHPKPQQTEGHWSRKIRRMMINSLDRDYAPLELHSLGCVYTGLFYRREFMGGVVEVSLADFMCGVVNVFHNKDAIEEYVETKARDGGNSPDNIFSLSYILYEKIRGNESSPNSLKIMVNFHYHGENRVIAR